MTGAIMIAARLSDLWVWGQEAELELLRVAYAVSLAPAGIATSFLVLLAAGALGYTLRRSRGAVHKERVWSPLPSPRALSL